MLLKLLYSSQRATVFHDPKDHHSRRMQVEGCPLGVVLLTVLPPSHLSPQSYIMFIIILLFLIFHHHLYCSKSVLFNFTWFLRFLNRFIQNPVLHNFLFLFCSLALIDVSPNPQVQEFFLGIEVGVNYYIVDLHMFGIT